MAKGLNRFYADSYTKTTRNSSGIKCVFISHQKGDADAGRSIADYLIASGIDVYFDEYDKDLRIHLQEKNPKKVTESILKGINASSHMLCLVSQNTLKSRWVPFEVGYGYDMTQLFVLTLAAIPKGGIPEYLRVVNVLRDIYDLNKFINGQPNSKAASEYNDIRHPLKGVMNSIINDSYGIG